MINMLCCIPGVSHKTAAKIHNRFESLKSMITCEDLHNELVKLDKIGPKLASSIVKSIF